MVTKVILGVDVNMQSNAVAELRKEDIKLLKKISRENNIIPVNKVMTVKKRYSRKHKHRKRYIEEAFDE